MKRFSEQLHKEAQKSVKLQAAERDELRERLVSYMEYHPLPAAMKASKQKQIMPESLKTEAFATFSIPFSAIFKSSAFAAVVLLVVVPMMAEKAVPGDTLYAIKVQTEELRSTLTFDGYQKVEWETERLNRRIAEARLLASEGRLTEEVEAEVAEAVRTHSENAKREIAELSTEDADEATLATIALDTTLEAQSTAYKGEEDAAGADEAIAKPVNLIAAALDESRTAPAASSSLPAYDKLMARVEINTTRVYELLSSLREVAPEEQLTDVVRRIEDLERTIKAATIERENDETVAREHLVDALQRTQKLIVYMTEIEVVETVDIETLVPVVLTEEEEVAQIEAWTVEVAALQVEIDTLAELVTTEAVLEKVAVASSTLGELSEQMASSTEEYSSFKRYATEALALGADTIALLERELGSIELPPLEEDKATTTDEVASSTEKVIIEEEIATGTEPVVVEETATGTAISSEETTVDTEV